MKKDYTEEEWAVECGAMPESTAKALALTVYASVTFFILALVGAFFLAKGLLALSVYGITKIGLW